MQTPPPNPSAGNHRPGWFSFLIFWTAAIGLPILTMLISYTIPLLFFRPSAPIVFLNSVSLFRKNYSETGTHATWTLHFLITNPNKRTDIYFKKPSFKFIYDRCPRGGPIIYTDRLTPFVLRKHQVMKPVSYSFALNVFAVYKNRSLTAPDDPILRTRVGIEGTVFFGSGYYKGKRGKLRVWCEGVAVEVVLAGGGYTGEMVGGVKECNVNLDIQSKLSS